MEKYYLTRLTNLSEDIDPIRRVKFIEIHYERRPQSFGVVYLAQGETSNGLKCQQLRLNTLELTSNNNARFNVVKSLNLITKKQDESSLITKSSIVDFDSISIIKMDETSSSSSVSPSRQQLRKFPQCIILQEDGNLLSINLINSTITNLINQESNKLSNYGSFLECKINHKTIEFNELYQIHLLTEKHYLIYKLSSDNILELENKYSLALKDKRKFVQFYLIDHIKSQLVILKLNDNSLQFINNSTCIYNFDLKMVKLDGHIVEDGDNNYDIVQIIGGPADEAIVMINLKTCINCYSIQINEYKPMIKNNKRKIREKNNIDEQLTNNSTLLEDDPYHLLPKQPSFEFEHCWTIDLNDIDCIRSIEEEEDNDSNINTNNDYNNNINCCPMYSTNQSIQDSSWPKFLLVAYRYHLLVYSFEQQPVLPFSVVYDKSFLQVVSMQNQEKQNSNKNLSKDCDFNEYIDTKLKPKLLHNFKLIGAQSSDSLFNTLFLVAKSNLIISFYFIQLRILLTMSDLGDIFLFKFTSSKINTQKDNVYQQLILDSIKGGHLLQDQVEQLKKCVLHSIKDIQNLVSKSNTSEHLNDIELSDDLSTAKLRQSSLFGCLHNLDITLSNMIQVDMILILSTIPKSYIIKPDSSSIIESIEINNNCSMIDNKSEELIQCWAVFKLYYNRPKSVTITLPIYIDDRESGIIKVFYILDNNHCLENSTERNMIKKYNLFGKLNPIQPISKFYFKTIQVKLLLSYQSDLMSDNIYIDAANDNNLMKFVMSGDFSADEMYNWLYQLINLQDKSKFSQYNCKLISSFTHCCIAFEILNENITVCSDDSYALELIKKNIFKKATNESKKIEIFDQIQPTINNLHHLIENQFVNVEKFNSNIDLVRFKLDQEKDQSVKVELLLESLFNEISFDDIPLIESKSQSMNNNLDWLELSFRKDIEKIIGTNEIKTTNTNKNKNSNEEDDNFERIEIKFIESLIIDALTEHDRLQGNHISDDLINLMRHKLSQIIEDTNSKLINKKMFADKIFSEWNKIVMGKR